MVKIGCQGDYLPQTDWEGAISKPGTSNGVKSLLFTQALFMGIHKRFNSSCCTSSQRVQYAKFILASKASLLSVL